MDGMEDCLVDALSDGRPPSRLAPSIMPATTKSARPVPQLSAEELEELLVKEEATSVLILVEAPGCGFCSLLRNTVLLELQKRVASLEEGLPLQIVTVQQLDSSATTLPGAMPWKERVPRLLLAVAAHPASVSLEHAFVDYEGFLTLTGVVDFVLRNLPYVLTTRGHFDSR